MRLTHRTLPLLTVGAVVLTACGGGSQAGSDALSGKSANDMVVAAARPSGGSFRFTISGDLAADTSGVQNVSADTLGSFGPLAAGFTFTGTGEAESAKRLSVKVTMRDSPREIVEVTYDGTAYVSNDGGKTFAKATGRALDGPVIGASPDAIDSLLMALPSVRDLGPVTVHGVLLEHLASGVDQSVIANLLQQPPQGGGTPDATASAIGSFIGVQGGSIDVYLRHDNGRLDQAVVTAQFTFDIGAMYRSIAGGAQSGAAAANAPAGDVRFSFSDDAKYTDYGAAITVRRPEVTASPRAAGPAG